MRVHYSRIQAQTLCLDPIGRTQSLFFGFQKIGNTEPKEGHSRRWITTYGAGQDYPDGKQVKYVLTLQLNPQIGPLI